MTGEAAVTVGCENRQFPEFWEHASKGRQRIDGGIGPTEGQPKLLIRRGDKTISQDRAKVKPGGKRVRREGVDV
jgi:hypothetical protein